MVNITTFIEVALSFPSTELKPHFCRTAFKVIGRRTFATLHEASKTANIVLSPIDQSVFCLFNTKAIYPVPSKFGLQGYTTFDLNKVPVELLNYAFLTSYNDVVQTKAGKHR